MKMTKKIFAMAGSALVAVAPAAASPVYSTDFGSGVGPEWSTTAGYNNGDAGIYGRFDGGVAKLTLPVSIGGPGTVTFDLLPFDTIDGAGNCCSDLFTASYDGGTLFSGYFGAGGGGSDSFIVPPGGSITSIGGYNHRITLAFSAVPGVSTFEFTYGALQGYGDESWALDNVSVEGTVVRGAVPEPASWALMIGGFGIAGIALRRRRASVSFA